MSQKIQLKWLIVIVVLALSAAAAQAAINIDIVPVGNLGNADDTHGVGYGGVSYAYNISKSEVGAGQYCEFLNAVAKTDDYGLYNSNMDSDPYGCQITQNGTSGSYTYDFNGGTVESPGSTASDWENRPVNYVSWGDAARFANWLHNGQPTGAQGLATTEDGAYYLNGAMSATALMAVSREVDWKWAIPSEDEWYKAAYHKNDGVTGNYFDYPTRNDSPPSNDLVEPTDPGDNATFYDSGLTIGSPYYRTEVGAHENSYSPYGTFDQAGNVLEWNEANLNGSMRGLRGGSFNGSDGTLHASSRYPASPAYDSDRVGFRVANVPEPGSITLLVCGAVAGLIWWRRRK